jgi:nucleoside diphosphate kinase
MNAKEFLKFFLCIPVNEVVTNYSMSIIKPDFMDFKNEYIQELEDRGYEIIFSQEFKFTKKVAEIFYNNLKEKKRIHDRTSESMSSGNSMFLFLRKHRDTTKCYQNLRYDLGPTNPTEADKDTIRRKFYENLYGDDPSPFFEFKASNVGHTPDSPESIYRETLIVILMAVLELI